jgi:hypothetical protein
MFTTDLVEFEIEKIRFKLFRYQSSNKFKILMQSGEMLIICTWEVEQWTPIDIVVSESNDLIIELEKIKQYIVWRAINNFKQNLPERKIFRDLINQFPNGIYDNHRK